MINLPLLSPLAERLLRVVRTKFEDEIRSRDIPLPDDEDKFWSVIDPESEEQLFNVLIGNGIKCSTLYKKFYTLPKHLLSEESVEGKKVDYYGYVFRDTTLVAFMNFLGYPGSNIVEQFRYLAVMKLDNEKDSEKIKEFEIEVQFKKLWGNVLSQMRRTRPPVREDIEDLINSKADLLRKTYAPLLCNTDWWLYFYGYDKLDLKKNRDSWPLIKLLFRFGEVEEDEIVVTIENTDNPEHYDYRGSTDFRSSQYELLVFNFTTDPHFTRQLNMKIHVGIGEGTLFLGQYLNYENDGNIISGTLVLGSAASVPLSQRKPKVHWIPKLTSDVRYTKAHDGVNESILQYLNDKDKNFRRTPLRAGHSLQGLQDWLDARYESEKSK
ncbi:hypothetical protein GCM10028807_59900 [Spirosoma daeguense]